MPRPPQTVMERVTRIESKLTRYIEEQAVRNARLDRMLDQWEDFKREWDEEGSHDDIHSTDSGNPAPVSIVTDFDYS